MALQPTENIHEPQTTIKVTILEALARESTWVGPNMSNRTTKPPPADLDDQ
jgi:hypothetical protein